MNITPIALCGLLLANLPGALIAAPRDFGEGMVNASAARLLTNARHEHVHWNGVGRIRNESQTLCTATLLDTRDADGKSGPAYVLTSSHCLHRLNSAVQKDLPIKGTVSFNYFDDTLESLKNYPLKTLKWSSSQGMDLAIIELQASLAALLKDGITPLRLAEEVPADGNDILALIAPEWDTLHLAACTQQSSRELVEQPFVWRITMKNQCTGITRGAFGGPLLDRATNTVFGILSTSTTGQTEERKCQRDSPCEVNSGQPIWHPETNYGSPVTFLNECFKAGVLQPDSEHCDLYPITAISFNNPEPIQQYFVKTPGGKTKSIVPRWNLTFTTNTPFYRYKTTRRAIDCESPVNYSAPIKAENAYINDAIGPQTGMHMLCIVGVSSPDQPVTNGMMRNALTLAVELAEPGPARTPNLVISLDKQGLGAYTVIWNLAPPFMQRYIYKYGPAATTDCLRPAGFLPIPPEPVPEDDDDEPIELVHPLNDFPGMPLEKFDQLISARTSPIKICTYAYDQADQPSTLRVDLLKPH
ncbi:serine protease [Pseudomonas kairouanensis]|uniref:Serine protease n=1 Tax=Pseudomonas kairouanensis TaxID=2293832 RepID=A0A4Z0AV16_9PSED|nr:trypsin-like peptidase domain-containing protein [Pseudomonas kairouanensis]TFY89758.1 serine protease [Pseudomonas kairouanensis]